MPKVSIVVPVYNAARFLEDTIRSVQAQTEKDWELLLVDDCSTDESRDVITRISERDSRVRLIRQAQNAGAAAARNRGICEAAGKYLAYLDADDLWKPERLSKELAFLEKEKAAFVFCGYEFADENGHGTDCIKDKIVHAVQSRKPFYLSVKEPDTANCLQLI